MSDDIFHSWKTNRFIVADYALLNECDIVVVLTDFEYWTDHYDSLKEWCAVNGGQVKGMTVSFDNNEQLTVFALKWS